MRAAAVLLAAFGVNKALGALFGDHLSETDFQLLAALCWLGAAFVLFKLR